MKAIWQGKIIAESPKEDLIRIEGNWYFPPAAIHQEFYQDSDHKTICPRKGEARYYDVVVDGQTNTYGAWYYPQPKESAVSRIGNDFTDYVAFWNGITVTE